MEAILLVLALLVIAAVLLYPVWRRSTGGASCGPCGTPTVPAPSTGVCFPSIPWTVKSGIIDLRGCNDDIYIFANRSRVHFIEESP